LLDKVSRARRPTGHILEVKPEYGGQSTAAQKVGLQELSAEIESKIAKLTAARSEGAVTATETRPRRKNAAGESGCEAGRAGNAESLWQKRRTRKKGLAGRTGLRGKEARSEQSRALPCHQQRRTRVFLPPRNLHIVDVYDADNCAGKRRFVRAYLLRSRIRKLVFYAYDLFRPPSRQCGIFIAWGAGFILSPGRRSGRGFGILHITTGRVKSVGC